MNYTKGKWKVTCSSPNNPKARDKFYSIISICGASEIELAKLSPFRNFPETEANANLIAAAPAIYEALKALVNTPYEESGLALAIGRQALAQAEGK